MSSRFFLKYSILVVLGLSGFVACKESKGSKPAAVRVTPNSGPAKANSQTKAKAKAAEEAKAKAVEEAKAKAVEEAKAKAAEVAKAKAAEEAKAKAAEVAKAKEKADAEAKAKTAENVKAEDEVQSKTPYMESMKIQAVDMIQIRSLAMAANHLFQQVWSKYWRDEFSQVNSVFGMLTTVLKAKFSEKGFPILPKVATSVPCRDHDFEVQISSSVTDKEVVTPISYILWALSCSGNTQARWKLAEITKGKGGQGIWGFQIQFDKSVLGNGIHFLGKGTPRCEIYPGSDGRLQKMSCQGIGQNRDRTTFIQFPKFEFDLAAENPLTGLGEVYKIDQNGQKILLEKISLKDIPRLNQFEFNIESFRTEPAPVIPSPAAPAPMNPTENAPEHSTAVKQSDAPHAETADGVRAAIQDSNVETKENQNGNSKGDANGDLNLNVNPDLNLDPNPNPNPNPNLDPNPNPNGGSINERTMGSPQNPAMPDPAVLPMASPSTM